MVQYVKSSRASSPNAKVQDVPNVPTIGTAIRNVDVIEVPFTPATTGGQAAIYRAVSNPGGIEAISFGSSPILVTNLDDGVARTFTVRGETSTGATTGFSAASNSVTVPRSALEPIARVTGTNVTNGEVIVIENIPQTYQDLMLVVSALPTGSGAQPTLRFNSITSTTYSQTNLLGNGSSASSNRRTGQSQHPISEYNNMSTTNPSSFIVHVLNYANTSTFKTALYRWAGDNNGSGFTMLSVGLLQTTSAISQLSLSTSVGGVFWGTNSTFTLYGIRAA